MLLTKPLLSKNHRCHANHFFSHVSAT
jgi:hypothetical protein